MGLRELRVDNFRCLLQVDCEPSAGVNLIVGANGSGKTSLLEAIYVLGRGRSFRAPRLSALVRTGQPAAVVFGELDCESYPHRLGIRIEPGNTIVHVDGQAGAPVTELVAGLPVQLIDPQVHDLVQGGPGERRRFLDWGVFHVKHEFLSAWRRFRRAQQQRNAALRQGAPDTDVRIWDAELAASGESIDTLRRDYLAGFAAIFEEKAAKMLDFDAKVLYRPGFRGDSLAAALADSLERDRNLGSTQVGPHRAELQLIAGDEPARHRLSRGQQKLLGASLVLAQAEDLLARTERGMVLLVDEPAAELDGAYLRSLIEAVEELPAQVFVTALRGDTVPFSNPRRLFHVERGEVALLV